MLLFANLILVIVNFLHWIFTFIVLIITYFQIQMKKTQNFIPQENQRDQIMSPVGFLSRKVDKKAAFVRKKCSQYVHALSKQSSFTSRLSRQNKNNRLKKVNSQISLKIITPSLQEQIKYLSPKHAYSSLSIKLEQSPQQQKRKNIKDQNGNALTSKSVIYNPFHEMGISDCTPSKISNQSFKSKYQPIETSEQTQSDWFGLQRQNQKLKQQNQKLEQQISILTSQLCKYKNPSIGKARRYQQCGKCKNSQAFTDLRQENKGLQAVITKSKQEIDMLKKIIGSINQQIQRYKQTASILSMQLNQSRQTQAQLECIMQSLKQKMEKDSLQLKYLAIQQDMLMRKKQEYQKFKHQNSRKGFERDSLRRMLNQYKQKIDLLRKVIVKGNNNKKPKLQDLQISLQLSLDSINNN